MAKVSASSIFALHCEFYLSSTLSSSFNPMCHTSLSSLSFQFIKKFLFINLMFIHLLIFSQELKKSHFFTKTSPMRIWIHFFLQNFHGFLSIFDSEITQLKFSKDFWWGSWTLNQELHNNLYKINNICSKAAAHNQP